MPACAASLSSLGQSDEDATPELNARRKLIVRNEVVVTVRHVRDTWGEHSLVVIGRRCAQNGSGQADIKENLTHQPETMAPLTDLGRNKFFVDWNHQRKRYP